MEYFATSACAVTSCGSIKFSVIELFIKYFIFKMTWEILCLTRKTWKCISNKISHNGGRGGGGGGGRGGGGGGGGAMNSMVCSSSRFLDFNKLCFGLSPLGLHVTFKRTKR